MNGNIYTKFHPEDFPDYEFRDGIPYRVTPVSRGRHAGFTGPLRSFVRGRDGHVCFQLTRRDGKIRTVSRNTILRSMNQESFPRNADHVEPLGDHRLILVHGFNDYAADRDGNVWRFRSPVRGAYRRLRKVEPVQATPRRPYSAYQLVHDTGRIRRLSREDVLAAAGFISFAEAAAVKARYRRVPGQA